MTRVRDTGGDAVERLRVSATWLAAVGFMVFAAGALSSRYLVADTYYDLYAGRFIVRHGIPSTDTLTVAGKGLAWIDQQWLCHLLFYGTWRVGGYNALGLLNAVAVTTAFVLVAAAMMRRGVPAIHAFLWSFAAYVACVGSMTIRPQTIAFPFMAAVVLAVSEDSAQPRFRTWFWLVVPLLVVWANVHGSVLVGAALISVYCVIRAVRLRRRAGQSRRYAAVAALACVAPLVTPYGWRIVSYYRDVLGNEAIKRNISEWAPPDPRSIFSYGFFALLLLVLFTMTLAALRGRRPVVMPTLLAGACLVLALTALRNQPWFALSAPLAAAATWARGGSNREPVPVIGFTVAGLLLGCAALAGGVLLTTSAQDFESLAPVHAVDRAAAVLRAAPNAMVLADQLSATPLLWLHPEVAGRVAFDARLEMYPQRELARYFAFQDARRPGWQGLADRYELVVVSSSGAIRALDALSTSPRWDVVFRDRSGAVLEQRG